MATAYDIIIIGGGVIGLSTACYLASSMKSRILVLEKDRLGEGSTGRCAGGIRLQFATEINIRFSLISHRIYEHFRDEFGVDIGFKQYGYSFLATTDDELKLFENNCRLQQRFSIPVELLSREELKKEWPFLHVDDLAGGTFCPRDGYAGPNEVVQGFYRKGKEKGVHYHENEEALQLESDADGITGVRTAKEWYPCRTVINAAGPYASVVAGMAGLELPVKPYRRQLFFTTPFSALPDRLPLTVDFHRGWYFRREGAGLLLSGTQDRHSSFDMHTDYEGKCFASEHALHRVPVTAECEIQGGWGGLYDISPDCHAIIGPMEALRGLYFCCGFSGHGFMHAPAAGMVMAELVSGRRAHTIDIDPLSPDRFRRGALLIEPMTVFKEK